MNCVNLTIEEIYLIHSCKSKERKAIERELERHLAVTEPAMSEIIIHTLEKLRRMTAEEFAECLEYPAEIEY